MEPQPNIFYCADALWENLILEKSGCWTHQGQMLLDFNKDYKPYEKRPWVGIEIHHTYHHNYNCIHIEHMIIKNARSS